MATLPAISSETLAFYKSVPTSIVTDGLGRLGLGNWMDDVHPLDRSWRASGRVRTLQYGTRSGIRHSSHSIYSWCQELEPGDIMVIGTGATRGWLLGENTAHFCVNHGLGGIVTDGRVRDVPELLWIPLPIFSRGPTARPFHFEVDVVAVDVPVECGGAYVRSGDLMVADADGIVIAPNEAVEALIEEASELVGLEKEQEIAIRERQPLSAIQAISKRKKVRKGPGIPTGGR
jgi:4-hydroxy-4-methyl-2-oxoglutarate aldolase